MAPERSAAALKRPSAAAVSRALLLACWLPAGLAACAASGPVPSRVVKPPAGGEQIFGEALPPRTVILTYDDGPDESTLPIARYLASEGLSVTFFVNGGRFCKQADAAGTCLQPMETRPCEDGQAQAPVVSPRYYPESLLDELLALGHRIGNHTQGHCHLTRQTDPASLEWEITATQEILDRHVRDGVFLFRAPFGHWDQATAERAAASKVWSRLTGPIKWDVDGGDWSCWQTSGPPERCVENYLRVLTARPNMNGIFILHDRPEFNVGIDGPLEMTKILVPRLRASGFKFATLDDLLALPRPPAPRP
jgi:peptidoglycan/xylan/chitin deacetylase (PgdA/CDA1 family)